MARKNTSKAKSSSAPRIDVYQRVTSMFVSQIEKALAEGKRLQWNKPWNTTRESAGRVKGIGVQPMNFFSKKGYRGINTVILWMAGMTYGYESPYWVTFNQAVEIATKQRKQAKKSRHALHIARLSVLKGLPGMKGSQNPSIA